MLCLTRLNYVKTYQKMRSKHIQNVRDHSPTSTILYRILIFYRSLLFFKWHRNS
ncbi:hypothetical protein DSUL_20581 [Desulfovibrionales bacterium]